MDYNKCCYCDSYSACGDEEGICEENNIVVQADKDSCDCEDYSLNTEVFIV